MHWAAADLLMDEPAALGSVSQERVVSQSSPDAIVVGAGPNGLVAANILADAGWSVLVVEAMDEPGGAVRSGGYLGQDTIADVCSAFYPSAPRHRFCMP